MKYFPYIPYCIGSLNTAHVFPLNIKIQLDKLSLASSLQEPGGNSWTAVLKVTYHQLIHHLFEMYKILSLKTAINGHGSPWKSGIFNILVQFGGTCRFILQHNDGAMLAVFLYPVFVLIQAKKLLATLYLTHRHVCACEWHQSPHLTRHKKV